MIPYIDKEKERFLAVRRKHNLYMVGVSYGKESLIKLGYSSGIFHRLRDYFTMNPFCKIIKTFYRPDAEIFEINFHRAHYSIVTNEWYFPELKKYIFKCVREWPIQKEVVQYTTKEKRQIFLDFMKEFGVKKRKHIERYFDIPAQNLLYYYDKIGEDYTEEQFLKDRFERRPDWYAKKLRTHRKKEIRRLRREDKSLA